MGGEALVAGGAARVKWRGVLEGGEDDGGLALGGDLGLEVLGDREQELLGAAAGADAGGDRVVWAQRAGGAAWRGASRVRPARRRQRAGAAEEPALAVAGAERAGDVALLVGLDAFASRIAPERSASALTAWTIAAIAGVGFSWTSRRSSLITSGRDEGHQRERAVVGADVVEGDREAEPAQGVDAGEHLGGAVGQRALGELEHDVELRPRAPAARRRARDRRVEQRRLDVDEQASGAGPRPSAR